MSAVVNYPGVSIEKVPSEAYELSGLTTSMTAFVGWHGPKEHSIGDVTWSSRAMAQTISDRVENGREADIRVSTTIMALVSEGAGGSVTRATVTGCTSCLSFESTNAIINTGMMPRLTAGAAAVTSALGPSCRRPPARSRLRRILRDLRCGRFHRLFALLIAQITV